MIKILQESLRLKLDSKETTELDMQKLSLLAGVLNQSITLEKEWLDEFQSDIEFELDKG